MNDEVFGHYVHVTHVDSNHVSFVDADGEKYAISLDEFAASWDDPRTDEVETSTSILSDHAQFAYGEKLESEALLNTRGALAARQT